MILIVGKTLYLEDQFILTYTCIFFIKEQITQGLKIKHTDKHRF